MIDYQLVNSVSQVPPLAGQRLLPPTGVAWQTSRTFSRMRSHARSLLSIAKLKGARSRHRLAICKRTRIAQISLSLRRPVADAG
jgi:hypothetical protein